MPPPAKYRLGRHRSFRRHFSVNEMYKEMVRTTDAASICIADIRLPPSRNGSYDQGEIGAGVWSPHIGFVSLTEAFDMTTPTGRAMAGMLAVFPEFEREILRERVKAGIAQARAKGTIFGRPRSAARKTAEIKRLYRKEKLSKSEIARRLGIGRTSVRRLLESD
jgi:hypothetical protein